MRYELHPEAELELFEAASFYEAGVSGLGRDFSDEVERVITILLEHPELGARLDKSLRHFVLRRFPFSVVYAVADRSLPHDRARNSSPTFEQLRIGRASDSPCDAVICGGLRDGSPRLRRSANRYV